MRRTREQITTQVHGDPDPWDLDRTWMLTRSVRNSDDIYKADYDLKKARERFRNHSRQGKEHEQHPWLDVKDWVGVTEIKRSSGRDGWNIHDHILISSETDRLPYSDWHRSWKRAAHDGAAHLDLQRVEGDAISYMAAYLSKGLWGGMTQDQAYWHRDFLRGRRFLRRKRGSSPNQVIPTGWSQCCLPDEDGDCGLAGLWDDF